MTTPTTPDTGIPAEFKLSEAERAEGRTQTVAKPAAMTSTPPLAQPAIEAPAVEAPAAQPAAPKANRKARRAAAKSAEAAKPAKAKAEAAKPAKAKAEATDEDGPKITRSIVPVRYKARYAEHEDTCGTDLSLALKHATTGKNEDGRMALLVPELFAIADANGIATKPYRDLNNGQKRMNVYNKLVGMLNAGKDVKVGKKTFRAKDWTPPAKPGLKAKVAKDAKPIAAPKAKREQPQAPTQA